MKILRLKRGKSKEQRFKRLEWALLKAPFGNFKNVIFMFYNNTYHFEKTKKYYFLHV